MVRRHNKTRRNKKRQRAGANPICKTMHARPMKCNTTPGCVYYSSRQQCRSKPTGKGSASQETQRVQQIRQKDMEKYPQFYRDSAARVLQRTRRTRKPPRSLTVKLIPMDGQETEHRVSSNITLSGLKTLASKTTGVPKSDIVMMHENLDGQIKTIEEIREQVDPNTQTVSIYTMVEPRDRVELFQEIADSPAMAGINGKPLEVDVVLGVEPTQATAVTISGDFVVIERPGLTGNNMYPLTHHCCIPIGQTTITAPGGLLMDEMGQMGATLIRGINVPQSIASAVELQSLNLEAAPILSLPRNINALANLTELRLVDTILRALPAEIGDLQNLRRLSIMNSCLTNSGVPSTLRKLTGLRSLKLSNGSSLAMIGPVDEPAQSELVNRLGVDRARQLAASPPIIPTLSSLTNLTELDLSNNYISLFPFTNMTNLHSLKLNDTFITSVPPQLYRLSELRYLSFSGSLLRHVSYSPEYFPALTRFDIRGCPLTYASRGNAQRLNQRIRERND